MCQCSHDATDSEGDPLAPLKKIPTMAASRPQKRRCGEQQQARRPRWSSRPQPVQSVPKPTEPFLAAPRST